MNESTHSNTLVGWREWVQLPGIGVPWIKAKIDTGAQTSSMHAYDQVVFEKDGQDWVRFSVHPWQKTDEDPVLVECPIRDRRKVRSSSGHVQERIVVLMQIVLAGREVTAEMTLSNRDQMGFRMLIGREALRHGFVVDSSRSFVGPRAPGGVRRRNRGRE